MLCVLDGVPALPDRRKQIWDDYCNYILCQSARHHTNAEIAGQLIISPLTTKSHVSSILTKLDARDRTQLVVMAYESGLVVPGHLRGS